MIYGPQSLMTANADKGTGAHPESTPAVFGEDQTLGKEDFLKLLTTQLRYQDPINPVEDQEFVAQLAQFSSLEQMQNLNSTMGQMMKAQQQLTALGQAMNMLGRDVELLTGEGEALSGRVEGVRFEEDWPLLQVDGQLYDFTEVVSIQQGGARDES